MAQPEYGRLLIDVADNLTLDDSLKLAIMFNLPPALVDLLRRVSFTETPGIQLLYLLGERNIINMFDITNLQKALLHIGHTKTNELLLIPYQRSVDREEYERNKTEELMDWPGPDDIVTRPTAPQDYIQGDTQEDIADDRTTTETGDQPVTPHHQHNPYIEHIDGQEGGTIRIAGTSLAVPAGALGGNQVIGVEVIRDTDMYLPGNDDQSRITPLIKLHPDDSPTATQKLRNFVSEPMGTKLATQIPGIGEAYGNALKGEGVVYARQVYGQFQFLGMDEARFIQWLKEITGDNSDHHHQACFEALNEFYNNFPA